MKNTFCIVDGKKISETELKNIDPNNIQSITVLKDEKSKEKYGATDKDCVIWITLKNNMTRRLNAKKLFSFRETAFLFYCSTFLTFIFARTNSITAGNKDTNIIATIRSFKFF